MQRVAPGERVHGEPQAQRSSHVIVVTVSAIAALLVASTTLTPAVQWQAPPGCPDAQGVLASAEAMGVELRGSALELDGEIEQVDGGYRLELSVQTSSGTTTRTMHAESCDELGHAAALVVSVAVDPLLVPAPPELEPPAADPEPVSDEPEPAVEVESAVPPPVPPNAPAEVAKPSEGGGASALQSALFLSGAIGRGISPRVDGRLQLGAAVDGRWVRGELLAFHAFAQRVEYVENPGLGARVLGWGGSFRVGPRASLRGLEVAGPVGVEAAAVVGDGYGADRSWARAELTWGVVAAPGLRVPLGRRVRVGADAEVSVAVRRPAFAVDGGAPLYRVPRVGVRGGLRVEVRFSSPTGDQSRRSRRPR